MVCMTMAVDTALKCVWFWGLSGVILPNVVKETICAVMFEHVIPSSPRILQTIESLSRRAIEASGKHIRGDNRDHA